MTATTAENLTDRQRDVLRLHTEGKNPTQIGTELGISSQGVHGHLRRLRGKGLIEASARSTAAAAATNGAPITAADALDAVRNTAMKQRENLAERKTAIEGEIVTLKENLATEIAALKAEDKAIDKALAELDAMVGGVNG